MLQIFSRLFFLLRSLGRVSFSSMFYLGERLLYLINVLLFAFRFIKNDPNEKNKDKNLTEQENSGPENCQSGDQGCDVEQAEEKKESQENENAWQHSSHEKSGDPTQPESGEQNQEKKEEKDEDKNPGDES